MRLLDDSTLHDPPSPTSLTLSGPTCLWVIASAEPQRVNERIELDREQSVLLGRRVEKHGAAFDDPKISRVHARIAWDSRVGAYRVADERSANGTFVDGRRVSVAALRSGSVLRLGGTVFVLTHDDVVGETERRLQRAAASELSVLLLGETGTGKERAARLIHAQSGRTGAFIAVNCATLPKELASAELFGHARGAFSGADKDRQGLFRAAEGGTLFLDEVGDLSPEVQATLLRALQERRVRPVGSERELPVDLRIVAATQRERVATSSFRSDLHARLAQIEIALPPLRERVYTLPALVRELAFELGISAIDVSPIAMEALALAKWPQNVRELRNLLARLRAFGAPPYALDQTFLEREAPLLLQPAEPDPAAVKAPVEAPNMSRQRLEEMICRHQGRASRIAEELGTSRTQVYRWLKRFGLAPGKR